MVMVEKTDMTAEMDKADKTVQVERLKTLPAADGFHMPGEFEPHKGTIMIWPERPGSWAYGAKDARKAFAKIAEAIAEGEEVYMLAGPSSLASAKAAFSGKPEKIHILPVETDDAWARDVGPTFVKNARKEVRGINCVLMPGGEKWMAFMQAGKRTMLQQRQSAMPLIIRCMMPVILCWKAVPSTVTGKELY